MNRIIFTVLDIARSLADHLAPLLDGVTFYEDPRQQLTNLPACFLQLMSSDIKLRLHGRFLRSLRFDLTYLEDFNLPDLQRRYQRVSEILDLNMETFPYEDALLRTYNRTAQIDLDALHYKFDLQIWLTPEEDDALMQTLAQEIRAYE
jgi:hypothetical protein